MIFSELLNGRFYVYGCGDSLSLPSASYHPKFIPFERLSSFAVRLRYTAGLSLPHRL